MIRIFASGLNTACGPLFNDKTWSILVCNNCPDIADRLVKAFMANKINVQVQFDCNSPNHSKEVEELLQWLESLPTYTQKKEN